MSVRYNIKNTTTKTSLFFKNNDLEDIPILLEDKYFTDVNSYRNITDYIYRVINKSEFLCRGLNPKYVLDAFNNVDAVVTISSSSMDILPNGNIFGFALLKFDEIHNSIYIDVICSHVGIKGAGDILINEIEEIGRRLFMTDIHLISVQSAIPFYKKYGYKKTNKLCNDMCMMIKPIHKRKTKSKSKTKSNSRPKTKSKSNSRTRKQLQK